MFHLGGIGVLGAMASSDHRIRDGLSWCRRRWKGEPDILSEVRHPDVTRGTRAAPNPRPERLELDRIVL